MTIALTDIIMLILWLFLGGCREISFLFISTYSAREESEFLLRETTFWLHLHSCKIYKQENFKLWCEERNTCGTNTVWRRGLCDSKNNRKLNIVVWTADLDYYHQLGQQLELHKWLLHVPHGDSYCKVYFKTHTDWLLHFVPINAAISQMLFYYL